MAKILKATQQQQVNRNKIILERLTEEHPERTRLTANQQLPSDADAQSDLPVAGGSPTSLTRFLKNFFSMVCNCLCCTFFPHPPLAIA